MGVCLSLDAICVLRNNCAQNDYKTNVNSSILKKYIYSVGICRAAAENSTDTVFG